MTRLLTDALSGILESCSSFDKYLFQDTHLDQIASNMCVTIENYTSSYVLGENATGGKCTASSYRAAQRAFDEKEKNREDIVRAWERRVIISVSAAYGTLVVVIFALVFAYAPFENNVHRRMSFIFMLNHNTPGSLVCSLVMFAFGVHSRDFVGILFMA